MCRYRFVCNVTLNSLLILVLISCSTYLGDKSVACSSLHSIDNSNIKENSSLDNTQFPEISSPSVPSRYAGPTAVGADIRLGRGPIRAMGLSTDREYIAIGSSIGLYVYQTEAFEDIWFGVTESSVESVAFSPDNHKLASGLKNGTLLIWDVASGELLFSLPDQGFEVDNLAWSSDSLAIASSGEDSANIVVWDIAENKPLLTLNQNGFAASSLAWSPVAATLAYGLGDGEVVLWDFSTKREVLRINTGSPDKIAQIAWTPNGGGLITGTEGGSLVLWNANTGQQLTAFVGHSGDPPGGIQSISFSPDGTRLVSGSLDSIHLGDRDLTIKYFPRVIVWNVSTGARVWSLDNVGSAVFYGSDNDSLLVSTREELMLWSIRAGQLLRTLEGHTDDIGYAVFSPDGKTIVSGSRNGITVWNLQTHELSFQLRFADAEIVGFAFNPKGTVFGAGLSDGRIAFWDTNTWKLLQVLQDPNDSVTGLSWSPDGFVFASTSMNKMTVWDINAGIPLCAIEKPEDYGVDIGWEGEQAIIASSALDLRSHDYKIVLSDVATGKQLSVLDGHTDRLRGTVWSPDGSMLASGSVDGKVIVWNAKTGEQLLVLSDISGGGLDWSPDSKMLITGSSNGSMVIWDVSSGKQIQTIDSTTGAAVWSPEGDVVAIIAGGTITLWEIGN